MQDVYCEGGQEMIKGWRNNPLWVELDKKIRKEKAESIYGNMKLNAELKMLDSKLGMYENMRKNKVVVE